MDPIQTPFSTYSHEENELPLNIPEDSSSNDMNHSDATWILLCGFTIFTMQLGFGLFEAGMISKKNQVNIMMKNGIDVILGGITYWMFGFGMSYGNDKGTNPFIAFGEYFFDIDVNEKEMGAKYCAFLFQLSFATTATTIVSGAMAERTNFMAYCVFSMFNTIIYCIPAGWVWGSHGFLHSLGVVDIAGSGPVHLIGGASALVAAWMLGPRHDRYKNGSKPPPPGNPMMICHGFFLLWFGWLAFNAGSTYGVTGENWKYCARAAVMTMHGAFGAGAVALVISLVMHKGKMEMMDLINGVLGGLVGITAGCFVYSATSALIVGAIGSALVLLIGPYIDKVLDDPVGATTVHGVGGIWGVIAVGLFAESVPIGTTNDHAGLFINGEWYLFGVQSLASLVLTLWGIASTFILLFIVDKIIPLRMDEHEEILGADYAEHNMPQVKCCECDVKEVHLETNRKTVANLFDDVTNRRVPTVRKNGQDNFGYEGRFTLKAIDSRIIALPKQENIAQESI